MSDFVEMINALVDVFVRMLTFVFSITFYGINVGALFVIGCVVSFAAWLIWGRTS